MLEESQQWKDAYTRGLLDAWNIPVALKDHFIQAVDITLSEEDTWEKPIDVLLIEVKQKDFQCENTEHFHRISEHLDKTRNSNTAREYSLKWIKTLMNTNVVLAMIELHKNIHILEIFNKNEQIQIKNFLARKKLKDVLDKQIWQNAMPTSAKYQNNDIDEKSNYHLASVLDTSFWKRRLIYVMKKILDEKQNVSTRFELQCQEQNQNILIDTWKILKHLATKDDIKQTPKFEDLVLSLLLQKSGIKQPYPEWKAYIESYVNTANSLDQTIDISYIFKNDIGALDIPDAASMWYNHWMDTQTSISEDKLQLLDAMEHAKKQLRVFLKRHKLEYVWDDATNDLKPDWTNYILDKNSVFYEMLLQLNQIQTLPTIKTWVEHEIQACNPHMFGTNIIARLYVHYGSEWIKEHYKTSAVHNVTNTWGIAQDQSQLYDMWKTIHAPQDIFKSMLTHLAILPNNELCDAVKNILQFTRHWGSKGNHPDYREWMSIVRHHMVENPKTWHTYMASQMVNSNDELQLIALPITYEKEDHDIWSIILQTMPIPESVTSARDGFSDDPRIDRTLYKYAYPKIHKALVFQKNWNIVEYNSAWIRDCLEYAQTHDLREDKWLNWMLQNDIHIDQWSDDLIDKAKAISSKYPMLMFKNTSASYDMSIRGSRLVDALKTKDMLIKHLQDLFEENMAVLPELKHIQRIDQIQNNNASCITPENTRAWSLYLLTKIEPAIEWSTTHVESLQEQFNTWKELGVPNDDAFSALIKTAILSNTHSPVNQELHYDFNE